MRRALLRIFVEFYTISTLLKFVRKITTHGDIFLQCRNNSYIQICASVGTITHV